MQLRDCFPGTQLLPVSALVAVAVASAGCTHSIVHKGRSLPANYSFFLFSYALKSCPTPGTLPLRSGHDANATIEAGYIDGPYCHGFMKYELYTGLVGTEPIYVRLEPAKPCAAYITVPVERLCVGVPLSQCASFQSARKQAAEVARLALEPKGVALEEKSLNATGFVDRDAFEQWCALRIREKFDATAHPAFLDKPAPAAAPNAQ